MRLVNLTEWRWPKVMVEYDWNLETWFVWWLKTDNGIHSLGEHDRKRLSLAEKLVYVCRCGDIYSIFGFRSYSTGIVCHYGNFYIKFWSSSSRECSSLSVFGHVHRFQSYAFDHLFLIKLTNLNYICVYFNRFKIPMIIDFHR